MGPKVARSVDRLYAVNERVVYLGSWRGGGGGGGGRRTEQDGDDELFFSLSAVGATNVGSIVVPSDPGLTTNHRDSK